MSIHKQVYNIIKHSHSLNLPYITHQQILSQLQEQQPDTPNLSQNVSQALYHLQQPKKLRPPVIKKVYHHHKFMGYTAADTTEEIEL